MQIEEIPLKGCYLITPEIHKDHRGLFFEAFNQRELEEKLGIPLEFVQDNHSVSAKGVLRGLHYQASPYGQSKLVRVAKGEVLDVMVDLRPDSLTFGKHFKIRLSGINGKMIFMPKGIAHGFIALQDDTHFLYKCGEYYNKAAERGVIFSDPSLNIDWEYPREEILLSEKDLELPTLKELGK